MVRLCTSVSIICKGAASWTSTAGLRLLDFDHHTSTTTTPTPWTSTPWTSTPWTSTPWTSTAGLRLPGLRLLDFDHNDLDSLDAAFWTSTSGHRLLDSDFWTLTTTTPTTGLRHFEPRHQELMWRSGRLDEARQNGRETRRLVRENASAQLSPAVTVGVVLFMYIYNKLCVLSLLEFHLAKTI
ncbi:hypothetical protein BC832DRAFT_472789 [Gaertneriomyces semiglobifer]|nr:hypothetical protein BC832DRAFT_472789 [Gaertneriomyces semiglobifer]